jgi:hypothetical protein
LKEDGFKKLVSSVVSRSKMSFAKARRRLKIGLLKNRFSKRAERADKIDETHFTTPKKRRSTKGTETVEKVRNLLGAHSVESTTWSARANRPKRTMCGSLQGAHDADEELQRTVSYRHLCRLTRIKTHVSLGIGKGSKRVDDCPDCEMWDSVIGPRWKNKAETLRAMMEEFSPDYWSNLNADVKEDGTPVHLALHLKTMLDYTADKMLARSADEPAEVGVREGIVHAELLQGVEVTSDYHNHFQLKDFLREYLATVRANPGPRTLRLWVDFKERGGTPFFDFVLFFC